MVEDHHSVDHAHQHPHDVLDPDDRDAELAADVLQHRRRLVHLGFVKPAKAFVGKQQARIGGQRLGELELFEPGGAEPGHRRRPVRWQPDESERRSAASAARARECRPWPKYPASMTLSNNDSRRNGRGI